jgi:hypothetical protein
MLPPAHDGPADIIKMMRLFHCGAPTGGSGIAWATGVLDIIQSAETSYRPSDEVILTIVGVNWHWLEFKRWVAVMAGQRHAEQPKCE